ncbi:amidohydrolase family protein [Desulfopila aestuarii]|uniref:5-methylthioadenosine/S-adenosylhomocysteine deaminase n=1 Tax=Desulfopila aestuarii DSM 18488 TaxID=1121416 RepID=A0A1M7Y8A7_9BACT|nr:amidohydrolase [Desulfopila aestuarii]SHO48875.1 5-methylthioadenosine/S-adenosylhomocysteine deaminase [Desulfopila aestuarii DSM 18488]
MQQPSLIVSGKWFLPGSTQAGLLLQHGLAITGDTITEIAPTATLLEKYPESRRLHTEHGLIMPGLINTHTHAPMCCFRGIADDLPLMTWLEEHIFPIEAQLTPEIVYQSALLSIAEMIKSGTTSFCDMYLFAKEVARAAAETGIRAWVGEVLYDFPSPCYGQLENGFAYIAELFQHYRNHPLISITTDPHSVYTCAPKLLSRLGQVAADTGSLYHTHLSENRQEVATCKERYGLTPVRHLDQLGLLGPNTLAAHCVMLDPDEIMLLAERGVKVSHCLESNMKLASGTAPIVELLAAGATVSLGTDGSASNNDVDLFGEMNCVAKVHKIAHLNPTVMNAETTLHAATMGGAAALSADDTIGTLAIGKKADCIVVDMDQPHLTPCYNIPSHLVYAVRGSDVLHSVINGQVVMQDRELTTIDETEILSRMTQLAKTIRAMH